MVGYILFLVSHSAVVRYVACFLVGSTAFVMGPLSCAHVSANVLSDTSRSSAIATNVLFGNIGGLVSSWSYLSKDAPHYRIGNGLNLTCSSMQLIVSFVALLWLTWDNKRRDDYDPREQFEELSEQQNTRLDWRHPAFRWKL
ncbi:hypothetical protein BDV33DRAFT_186411, partial [Aspergillus novoparasiticus]